MAATGEWAVDAPAGVELTSINVDSAAGVFTGQAAENLGGRHAQESGTAASAVLPGAAEIINPTRATRI